MDAADPELSAGKNVHEGHMKKRHFVLFRGQFFTRGITSQSCLTLIVESAG